MTDTPNPLPPLSPAALRSVQRIRSTAIRDLTKCNYPGTSDLDHISALEVMRTHVLQELAVRVDFYISLRELPSDWSETVAVQAIHSAISWFPRNQFYLRTEANQLILEVGEQFVDEICRTVHDHLLIRLTAYIEAGKVVVADRIAKKRSSIRASSTIESQAAARKVEAYVKAKGIGYTEFATSAHTTDKTLRSFRQTGKIRRSIFADIAKAMGTTKEDLLIGN